MGQIAFKNPYSLQTLPTSVRNIFCDSITVSLLEPQELQAQNFAKRPQNEVIDFRVVPREHVRRKSAWRKD